MESTVSVLNGQYLGLPLSHYHLSNPATNVELWSISLGRWLEPAEFSYAYSAATSSFELNVMAGDYVPIFWVDADGDGEWGGPYDLQWWNSLTLPANGGLIYGRIVPIKAPISSYTQYEAGTCSSTSGKSVCPGPALLEWETFPEQWAIDSTIAWLKHASCADSGGDYVEYIRDPSDRSMELVLPPDSEVAVGVDFKGASSIYGEPVYIGLTYTDYLIDGQSPSRKGTRQGALLRTKSLVGGLCYGARYGLFIGVHKGFHIGWGFLPNDPHPEAQAMHDSLDQLLHFEDVSGVAPVMKLEYETPGNYFAIRDALFAIGEEMGPSDLFVLYYSGHGAVDDSDPSFQALSIGPEGWYVTENELANWISGSMPSEASKVAIIDTCYSGGYWSGDPGLEDVSSMALLASTASDEFSYRYPWPSGRNIYTAQLLDGLSPASLPKADKNGNGLTFRELHEWAFDGLLREKQEYEGIELPLSSLVAAEGYAEMTEVLAESYGEQPTLESSVLFRSSFDEGHLCHWAGVGGVTPSCEAPLLVNPPDGAIVDAGRTDWTDGTLWCFEWTPVSGASQYEILIDCTLSLSGVPCDEGSNGVEPFSRMFVNSPEAKLAIGLTSGTYVTGSGWFWRVRAMSTGGWGPWSDTWSFEMEPLNTDPPGHTSTLDDCEIQVP